MTEKQEVWIFYSSETEPNVPKLYSEGIAYLHETEIKTHVIDIDKRPELVEKHKIIATPTVLIKKGTVSHKYFGIAKGLKKLLMNDLYGKSILHILGFKEGRELGKKIRFVNVNQLEKELKTLLSRKGIKKFRILKFNKEKKYVKVNLVSGIVRECEKDKTPVCFEIAAFLGGIFTEIFDMGIHFKEIKCMAQGYDCCEFETIKVGKKKTLKMAG